MTEYLLYFVLAAYFGATALWLAFFLIQRESLCRYGAWALAAGLAGHTMVLIQRTIASGYLPVAVFGEALLLFDWVLVAAFLFLNWRYPIRVLGELTSAAFQESRG